MSKLNEYWIYRNESISGPDFVLVEQPFGSHSHQYMHVIDYSAYQKAIDTLKMLEKYVAHNGDDWVQIESRAVLKELGEMDEPKEQE